MESSVWGITMILLKDVSYEWEDGRTALKNVNLEIKKDLPFSINEYFKKYSLTFSFIGVRISMNIK